MNWLEDFLPEFHPAKSRNASEMRDLRVRIKEKILKKIEFAAKKRFPAEAGNFFHRISYKLMPIPNFIPRL